MTTDNTTYVTRPKGKPEVTTRGKMNEWANGYKEFIPQGTRENQREMLKQLGDSSFYKTTGKKDSSWSVHLNVDAKDCEDHVAALEEQFMYLTAEDRKTPPQLPQQGRMLLDNGQGLQIWLDSEKGKVSILAELNCDSNIERQLLQAQSQMNVAIGRHRSELVKLNNNK